MFLLFRDREKERIKQLVAVYKNCIKKHFPSEQTLLEVAGEYKRYDQSSLKDNENYQSFQYARQSFEMTFNKDIMSVNIKDLIYLIITREFPKYNRMPSINEIRNQNNRWEKLKTKIDYELSV